MHTVKIVYRDSPDHADISIDTEEPFYCDCTAAYEQRLYMLGYYVVSSMCEDTRFVTRTWQERGR